MAQDEHDPRHWAHVEEWNDPRQTEDQRDFEDDEAEDDDHPEGYRGAVHVASEELGDYGQHEDRQGFVDVDQEGVEDSLHVEREGNESTELVGREHNEHLGDANAELSADELFPVNFYYSDNVHRKDVHLSLFPPPANMGLPQEFLLKDSSLAYESWSALFGAMREILHSTILNGHRLFIEIPDLGWCISEDSEQATKCSLADVFGILRAFGRNEGREDMILNIDVSTRVSLESLQRAADAGKTLQQVVGFEDGEWSESSGDVSAGDADDDEDQRTVVHEADQAASETAQPVEYEVKQTSGPEMDHGAEHDTETVVDPGKESEANVPGQEHGYGHSPTGGSPKDVIREVTESSSITPAGLAAPAEDEISFEGDDEAQFAHPAPSSSGTSTLKGEDVAVSHSQIGSNGENPHNASVVMAGEVSGPNFGTEEIRDSTCSAETSSSHGSHTSHEVTAPARSNEWDGEVGQDSEIFDGIDLFGNEDAEAHNDQEQAPIQANDDAPHPSYMDEITFGDEDEEVDIPPSNNKRSISDVLEAGGADDDSELETKRRKS
ncbi:hypothetical protein K402DRAFT_88025 [Aulographum hederae CBS 113979]|uniref:Uncharacterized protein n=1 Tax=Aulographum hederae CBS 113979 TaxID=1176131 RepID=A0A6G1GZL8_9PEZI|nr:hypothetical protein K402DRAFT_88025 [Aulographum hederae CBS 113979]